MKKEQIGAEFRKFISEGEEEVEPRVLSRDEFIIVADNAFDTLAARRKVTEDAALGLSNMVQKANYFEAHPDFTVLYVQHPDTLVLALRVESKGDMGFKHEGKIV